MLWPWILGLAAAKPHIIFHVIDDWGYHDVGFRNQQIKTPVLDRYQRQGLLKKKMISNL